MAFGAPPEPCAPLEPCVPLELCVPLVPCVLAMPCVPNAFCMAEEFCAAEERPFAAAVGGEEEPFAFVPDVPKRGDSMPLVWPPP